MNKTPALAMALGLSSGVHLPMPRIPNGPTNKEYPEQKAARLEAAATREERILHNAAVERNKFKKKRVNKALRRAAK